MKTTYDFTIIHADHLSAGYGHKKITVEIECNGEYKKFTSTTNFMPGFDRAADLEGQEKYDAMYELIRDDIDENIMEWIDSLED